MNGNKLLVTVRAFIKLIRPHHWYKNLLVIVPAIFSLSLFRLEIWPILLASFTSACLISGANYIINDIRDLEKDKRHPSKRLRPLPSNLISVRGAAILSTLIALAGFFIAYYVNLNVLLMMILLFLNTQLYSFLLKNYVLIDITSVSLNYVIRAVVGAYAISVPVSPWLVIGIFSLALLLSLGKRVGELLELGDYAENYRTSLKYYGRMHAKYGLSATSILVIAIYTIYSLQVHGIKFILTIPFAVYLIVSYTSTIWRNTAVASNPSILFKYWKFTLVFAIWIILVLALLYLL